MTRGHVAGLSLITAGSMTANAAGYLLQLVASRALGPSGFGEFASLLAVQLVLAVPALALQAVVAREIARGAPAAVARALSWRCALLVAALVAVAVPTVVLVLHAGTLATLAAAGSAPVLVLLAGEQGILQGHSNFRALGGLFAAAGLARVMPALGAFAAGGNAATALLASLGGTVAVTAATRALAAGPAPAGAGPHLAVAPVLLAAQAQGAVLALSSVDVLAAQLLLDRDSAGRYALGAVAAKIAFWLPQAVGVVLYPRLAQPSHSVRAMRTALAVLVGLGGVAVAGAAVAAPLAPVLAGAGYAPVQGMLWAFALNGALQAILQAALLAAIARQHTRLAGGVWAGLVAAVAVMLWTAHSVTSLLAVTVAATAVTTVALCAAALSGPRRRPETHNAPGS